MSHNTMTSFISSTDFDDLMKNSSLYNYYVSLVVSFDEKFVCKVGIPSSTKVQQSITFKDFNGREVTSSREVEEQSVIISPLVVEHENDTFLEDWFIERINNIKKEAVEKAKKPAKIYTEKDTLELSVETSSNNTKINGKKNTKNSKFQYNVSNDVKFALSIINGGIIDVELFDVYPSIYYFLKEIKEQGAVIDLSNLYSLIPILHDEIYGTLNYKQEIQHVKEDIRLLEVQKSWFPDIVISIVETLEDYCEYAKQSN